MDRTLLSRCCKGSYLFYVVVLLVILCSIDKILAQKTVAYYPFENSYRPLATGQCPTPSYFNSPSGTATFAASNPARSGLGQAVAVDSTAGTPTTLSLGTWSISSTSYSIACWIYVNGFPGNPNNVRWNVVTKGGNSWSIDLVTKNNPRLEFVAGISTGGTVSITGNTQLGGNTGWIHAVAVFDSANDQLRLYTNGNSQSPQSIGATLTPSETTSAISIGQVFHGLVDELHFFDYALTASQATALYQKTATTTLPTITLPTVPLIIPVGQSGFVNGSVTNANGNPVSLQWSLQASCITANFGSPSAAVTSVAIDGDAFQTYTLNLVATDTVTTLCVTSTVDVTLDGTLPGFDASQSVIPPKNQLPVPLGSVGTITIALTGSPTPRIKWQELVDVAVSGGRRSDWMGLHHPTHPRLDVDWVYERAMAAFARCNATANFTTDCSEWLDIANQTSISYTTPVADLTLNGTMIRFVASNAKGTFFSTPFTIFVTEPISGGGGGDGGSDSTGAIVGGVVGGVGGCLLLCCLCILLLVILILLKRRKSDDFPGIPPDYEQVIFGQYLDPMFKLKSKQENSLEKLEKLLIADPDFNLVLAMAAGCKKTEDEKLARALVYALYPNEKCGASLEILISNLLNATEEKSTLFRANTVETKMVKYYAILVGAPYLWEILARFIWEIQRDALLIDDIDGVDEESGSRSMSMSMSSRKVNLKSKSHTLMNMGMEIDPSKMDEAADPKVNTLQLWLTAQKILSAITRSADELPKELADFLVFVHNEVETRFSGEEYKAMGGFLFLRFICPSLLAPHLYGLLEEPPSPTAQRQYILIGKVLQNLSNNTLPGAKEEYMNKLNEFITNNQDDLHGYYDKVLAARGLSEAQRRVPDQVKRNALAEIHNILISSQKGVEAELANFYEEGDPIYQQLTEIVAGGPIPANE